MMKSYNLQIILLAILLASCKTTANVDIDYVHDVVKGRQTISLEQEFNDIGYDCDLELTYQRLFRNLKNEQVRLKLRFECPTRMAKLSSEFYFVPNNIRYKLRLTGIESRTETRTSVSSSTSTDHGYGAGHSTAINHGFGSGEHGSTTSTSVSTYKIKIFDAKVNIPSKALRKLYSPETLIMRVYFGEDFTDVVLEESDIEELQVLFNAKPGKENKVRRHDDGGDY